MARKATAEELAMNQSAENEDTTFTELVDQLESGAGAAVDNTGAGDFNTDTVTPKRKRGRPSRAESALNETLDKENPGAASAEGTGNKPGRKPGRKSAPSAAALGKQLVGIHALAAMFTQLPEVQITEQEGEMLGSAIVAVCEEYSLSITGKTGAAIQLFAAAAMIYAPRAYMIKARINAAQEQAKAAANPQTLYPVGNVHEFTPGQN